MDDLKERLDRRARRFRPAPGGLERIVRRAGHRYRTRRITAGVVALGVFAAASAGLWAVFREPETDREPITTPSPAPTTTDPGFLSCEYPAWRPSYLGWEAAAGDEVPPPMEGIEDSDAVLRWESEDPPEERNHVALWRSLQSTVPDGTRSVLPAPPLPDGTQGVLYEPAAPDGAWIIVWPDPSPDAHADECAETAVSATLPVYPRDVARGEILKIALSLAGGDLPPVIPYSPQMMLEQAPPAAVWPEDTREEMADATGALIEGDAPEDAYRWRSDPEELALEFARLVLEWPGASATPLDDTGDGVVDVRVDRADGEAGVVVRAARALEDSWWTLEGVQGDLRELSVRVLDGTVTLALDLQGARSVDVEVGYDDRQVVRIVDTPEVRFELGFSHHRPPSGLPTTTGHLLMLFRDDQGRVFDAHGFPLPSGDYVGSLIPRNGGP